MRLIDADALMREFAEFVRRSNNSDFADIPTWNDAVSLLGSAPTIEPNRGRWVWKIDKNYSGGGKTTCTACGYSFSDGEYFEVEDFNFCPNCGARMEV